MKCIKIEHLFQASFWLGFLSYVHKYLAHVVGPLSTYETALQLQSFTFTTGKNPYCPCLIKYVTSKEASLWREKAGFACHVCNRVWKAAVTKTEQMDI